MLLQYGIPNTNRYNIKIEKITDRIGLIYRADTFDNTFDQLKSVFGLWILDCFPSPSPGG